jgi:hypothetical protein
VTQTIDSVSFDSNSIYSPIQAKQIVYDKETYNAQTQEWSVNTQSDQSGLLGYLYLKAAMNCQRYNDP